MKTIKQHISETYDGKFVGDSRNTFTVVNGQVVYTQRGTDIYGKPFENVYTGPGFMLEVTPVSNNPNNQPRRRLEFRMHPVRMTGSLEEMLFGTVFGSRTDVEALGLAKVVEVTASGRGRVQTLWGDDAKTALDALGYPDIETDLALSDEPYQKAVYQDG